MPAAGVYLVFPSQMALIPAILMLSGVLKSGSPVPKPTTSSPSAFICFARLSTARVVDARTASAILDTGFIISHLRKNKNIITSNKCFFNN